MNIKYAFVFAIMCMFLNNAHAQPNYAIDKGALKLGGGLNFSSTGSDDFEKRQNAFSVFPNVKVFVIPGLAVGGTIGFSSISGIGNSFNTLGIGPAISYYFGNEDSKVFPYIAGNYLFNTRLGDEDFTSQNAIFSAGGAYMIARNVAINGELFLQLSGAKLNGVSSNTNTFGLLFGVDLFVFGGTE